MLGASNWRLRIRKNCFRIYAVKSRSKFGLNGAMILIYHSTWHNGGIDFDSTLNLYIVIRLVGIAVDSPCVWIGAQFGLYCFVW